MKEVVSTLTVLIFLICACIEENNEITAKLSLLTDQFFPDEPEVIDPPSITIQNLRKDEKAIKLISVKANVEIVGSIAVTTWDMIFYNPNDRLLEGEFQFPLANQASLSGFALDIDGKLREAVPVEKTKGRQVFEDVIRQQIDPALLEQTEGNNFRARIYPLPPKGERRIMIRSDQPLIKQKDAFHYYLPLSYKTTLDNFEIDITVIAPENVPKLEKSKWFGSGLIKEEDNYSFSQHLKSVDLSGHLAISIPTGKKPSVFIEKGKKEDETFFYAYIQPENKLSPKITPKQIAVYWDNSLSMEDAERDKEFELLDKYFQHFQSLYVELYLFNCTVSKPNFFSIRKGDWSILRRYLESVIYDGATDFGQLDFRKNKADEILIFSDGINNLGNKDVGPASVPVYAITNRTGADYSFLRYLSSGTGGTLIDLSTISSRESLPLLTHQLYRLITTSYDRNQMKDIAYLPEPVTEKSGISISGKLIAEEAELSLHFGFGNTIIHTEKIYLSNNRKERTNGLAERLWAINQLSLLDINYKKNKEEISQLSKKYGIVSRNTSLIVLDRIEDYLQYDITPPDELLEEYLNRKNKLHTLEQKQKKDHLEYVVRLFNERKKWWTEGIDYIAPGKRSFEEFIGGLAATSRHIIAPTAPGTLDISAESIAMDMSYDEAIEEVVLQENPVSAIVREDVIECEEEVMYCIVETEKRKKKIDKHLYPQTNNFNTSICLKEKAINEKYLQQFSGIPEKNYYNLYLKLRNDHKENPAFYTDIANLFYKKGMKEKAFVILSNLAELDLENHKLLRGLGHFFLQWNYTEAAICILEKVKELRPDEAQSLRDLAHAYAQDKQYQEAVNLLNEITLQPWDNRFPEIESIATMEMNEIINRAEYEKQFLKTDHIDSRLLFNMPVDIRVIIGWNTDNTDIDLWITDPTGEVCKFSNRFTAIGGMLSRDFTRGFGPEEFLLKRAIQGKYLIQAHYYGNTEQILQEPVMIYMDIYTHYGRKKEEKRSIIFRLSSVEEVLELGDIRIGK